MTDPKQQLQEQIKALSAEYLGQLPERLNALDVAFAAIPNEIQGEDARPALEDLHALAHKLNGSAGTFGFMDISDAAERLEDHCQALLDGAAAKDGREALTALAVAVRDAIVKALG